MYLKGVTRDERRYSHVVPLKPLTSHLRTVNGVWLNLGLKKKELFKREPAEDHVPCLTVFRYI